MRTINLTIDSNMKEVQYQENFNKLFEIKKIKDETVFLIKTQIVVTYL